MATVAGTPTQVAVAAKRAARELAQTPTEVRDRALLAVADALDARCEEILAANALDLEAGVAAGLDAALIDRLSLDPERVAEIANGVRQVVALPDPVGEVIEQSTLQNGLLLRRVRMPLGVVTVIYEARPNVTIDSASLCIKSGNAIVLRGSSTAGHSNAVLASIAIEAAEAAGLPAGSIGLVAGGGRDELRELAQLDGVVDLIIPRGGDGLKRALSEVATVPVLYAASGNCHVYVDAAADLAMAERIIVNAKAQRPGVCNSAETLLVHETVAEQFLPSALAALRERGVELRGDVRTRQIDGSVNEATDDDWDTEYHALILAVKVVGSADEAIDHIEAHGSSHSEAIVTEDRDVATAFERGVNAACVYVNASTRFTDGAVFGMGAEIGNATQKLHARGPIGLRELTTYKYLIEGTGQVRE